MATKKLTAPRRKRSPNVPPWMQASWKAAGRKKAEKFTARDVDAIISEVRAGKSPKAYKPVELSIILTKSQAAWLKRIASEQGCSIEELILNAVAIYQSGGSLQDRPYFTKAISEGTENIKIGRYEP